MLRTSVLILASLILLAACQASAAPPTVSPPQPPTTTPSPPVIETSTPAVPTPPVIEINSGEIQGTIENGLHVLRGIPYAAAPVGDLRWQVPQPAPAWDGVRQVTAFGKSCIQPNTMTIAGSEPVPQSEDCLFVNVWSPNVEPDAKLPVMVWIHGGALVIGTSSLPIYDGSALAERGAVVVSLNYRLGPLGFFNHPALNKGNPDGPVNFGLYDQIAALNWVKENIAQFGGDLDNVTIFGESAGAQSVLALFASPLARGLFHKGVAQSSYSIPGHTRSDAEKVAAAVATAVGLDGANATLEELRAVPAEKFASMNGKATSLAPVFVTGDPAVPQPILNAFQNGTEAAVPLIIGSNSDEATVATAFGIDPAKLIDKLGLASIAVKALYPGVTDDGTLGRYVIRDLIFTSFARRMSELHSRTAPAGQYYFSYVPENLRDTEPGVPHGGEIPFVFGTGDIEYKDQFTDADRAISKAVGDYWFEFARSGTPTAEGQPDWLQTSRANDQTMEFGETIALQKNFMRTRLDVYIGLLNIVGRLLGRE